ncbi:MAG: glycosyltransferase family 2 protein [Candidatus Asgardarchaeia archaeon]
MKRIFLKSSIGSSSNVVNKNKQKDIAISYPLVSIIVINFRDKKNLVNCVRSISKSNYPKYEIIIVDCLTDNFKEIIHELEREIGSKTSIKFVHFNHDIGAAKSHNVGYKLSSKDSEILVFLDNDTIVDENWLQNILRVFEKDDNIKIVQPMLLREDKTIDAFGGVIDRLGYTYPIKKEVKWLKGNEEKNVVEIPIAKGAAIAVKKIFYREICGFDSLFFIYYDDTDFCWRTRLSGGKIALAPKAVVIHRGSSTTKFNPFIVFHIRKNQIMFLLKNYEFENVIKYTPLLILTHIAIALRDILLDKNVITLIKTIQAYTWILKNLSKIIKKRYVVQEKIRKIPDNVIFETMTTKINIRKFFKR